MWREANVGLAVVKMILFAIALFIIKQNEKWYFARGFCIMTWHCSVFG